MVVRRRSWHLLASHTTDGGCPVDPMSMISGRSPYRVLIHLDRCVVVEIASRSAAGDGVVFFSTWHRAPSVAETEVGCDGLFDLSRRGGTRRASGQAEQIGSRWPMRPRPRRSAGALAQLHTRGSSHCHPFGKRCGVTRTQSGEDDRLDAAMLDARIPGLCAGGEVTWGTAGMVVDIPTMEEEALRGVRAANSESLVNDASRMSPTVMEGALRAPVSGLRVFKPHLRKCRHSVLAGLRTAEVHGSPANVIDEFRRDIGRLVTGP